MPQWRATPRPAATQARPSSPSPWPSVCRLRRCAALRCAGRRWAAQPCDALDGGSARCLACSRLWQAALPPPPLHLTAAHPCPLPPLPALPPQMMRRDFPNSGATLSGLGGVNTGRDAAEFILLGSNTVQVRRRSGGSWAAGHIWHLLPLVQMVQRALACWQARAATNVPLAAAPLPAGLHGRHAARLPAGQDALRRPAGGRPAHLSSSSIVLSWLLFSWSRHSAACSGLQLDVAHAPPAPHPARSPPLPRRPSCASTTSTVWRSSGAPRCPTSPPTTSWCAMSMSVGRCHRHGARGADPAAVPWHAPQQPTPRSALQPTRRHASRVRCAAPVAGTSCGCSGPPLLRPLPRLPCPAGAHAARGA